MDDELPLLQLLEKYLTRLGFQVETHSRAFDALQRFQAQPGAYDLVVADLGIPDMPGDSLLTRMLDIRPDLPILVCSGSPFVLENLSKTLEKQVAFLQKPFVPKMLSEVIQRLLSQRAAGFGNS